MLRIVYGIESSLEQLQPCDRTATLRETNERPEQRSTSYRTTCWIMLYVLLMMQSFEQDILY